MSNGLFKSRLSNLNYRSLVTSEWLWQMTMAVASGLLLLVSFPSFSSEYAAWVALAPLIYVVTGGVSRRRAAALGWATGLFFTFFAENWIAHSMTKFGGFLTIVAYAVALLFAAVLAIFPALFAVALVELHARLGVWAIAAVPLFWVASEWLRPIVTGVTWNALGVSQYQHYGLARLSQWGGVYLISWVVAAGSALAVLLIRSKSKAARRAAALVIIQILIPLLLPPPARMRPPDPEAPQVSGTGQKSIPVSILGVQPDIALTDDERLAAGHFDRVKTLTRDGLARAKEQKPEIIIWAEAPIALFYENDPRVREEVDRIAAEAGAYVIANTITREGDRYFNSVHIASPRPSSQASQIAPLRRYDKIRLVPFGEYVPWRAVLGRFVPAIVGDFTPGREAVVNVLRLESQRAGVSIGEQSNGAEYQIERETRFVRVGSFICYEAAYPDIVREFVKAGATLLVNVSNDAWFGETAGPEQHLAHAVMRAIENDRDLVRVTNSGITTLVTAEGEIIDPLPRFAAGAQIWRAEARSGRTFYTRRGDLFARICAALTALIIVSLVVTSIRARRRL
jgi:apolipoprotein N-acyltransferase